LSEVLGGLPLADEQAAAYCERLDISLADYRKRFEAASVRFLDDARDAPTKYHDGLTVAKTFELAIEEAAKLHRAAEPLIIHAALLAPEPIPCSCLPKRGKNLTNGLLEVSLAPAWTRPSRCCGLSPSSAARRSWMSAMREERRPDIPFRPPVAIRAILHGRASTPAPEVMQWGLATLPT
jgi:hypothetical protein